MVWWLVLVACGGRGWWSVCWGVAWWLVWVVDGLAVGRVSLSGCLLAGRKIVSGCASGP